MKSLIVRVITVLAMGCSVVSAQSIFDDDSETGAPCRWSAVHPPVVCEGALYWGDFDQDAVFNAAETVFSGSAVKKVFAFEGLQPGAVIDSLTESTDRIHLAVSGTGTGGTGVLNVYRRNGEGAPVTLVDTAGFTNTSATITDLAYSPDGAWIAFLADADINGEYALWVVDSTGAGSPKRLSQMHAGGSTQDVLAFEWSPRKPDPVLVYVGDLIVNGINNIWSVDPSDPVPAPVNLYSSMSVDVGLLLDFDANGRVYYVGEDLGSFVLYRVDVDGTNLQQVPGTSLGNSSGGSARVGPFAISADGGQLAFAADAPTVDLYQVYVMDLGSTTPELVSGVTTSSTSGARGPNLNSRSIVWSRDGDHLAVIADWEVAPGDPDNQFAVFALPTTAPAGGVRILGQSADATMDAAQIDFTMNSQRLIVLGDLVANNDTELFSTTDYSTSDQAASAARFEAVPTGGDVTDVEVP